MEQQKKELRKSVSALRDALAQDELASFSSAIQSRLEAFSKYQSAKCVMLFSSFRSEVRTLPIAKSTLALGKRVVLPVTLHDKRELLPCEIHDIDKDLAPGHYGILEPPPSARHPIDPEEIDLVCMPGLAFDFCGNRLGYGGGYYDRFVRRLKPGTPLVAIAFSCQVVDTVPTGPNDHRVGYIVTERELICCKCDPPASPL